MVEHAQHDSLDRLDQLFYEQVNYVASRAYDRIVDDEEAFYDTLRQLESDAGSGTGRTESDMGEDFDFDDDSETARRLPRLVRCLSPGA